MLSVNERRRSLLFLPEKPNCPTVEAQQQTPLQKSYKPYKNQLFHSK